MNLDDLAAIRRQAAGLGYGLQAVLPVAAVPALVPLAAPWPALWLVCNTGDAVQARWRAGRPVAALLADNAAAGPASCGPLDDFCRAELGALLGLHAHRVLHPQPSSAAPLPLLAVLEAAGWLRPGPFMNTLHAGYGSWWAVRAVIALDAEADAAPEPLGASPCRDCPAPCVHACPAGAVARSGWDGGRCLEQRLADGSPCAGRCPAREICPAGRIWRYETATIAYHYGASQQTLRNWRVRNRA